jgi:hypothetical protein
MHDRSDTPYAAITLLNIIFRNSIRVTHLRRDLEQIVQTPQQTRKQCISPSSPLLLR